MSILPTRREQLLVDMLFGSVLLRTPTDQIEVVASNISKMLLDSGFPTTPCGASWGVLDKEGQEVR
jgi:hypothetical protein